MTTGECWRLLPFDRGSSLWHFALSDALARLVTIPTVWWHATEQPTLILGTGQHWRDVNLQMCRERDIAVIRRHAGGTAVLATGSVLGLDIALPQGHRLVTDDVVQGYRWLGEVWQDACAILDVPTELASVDRARRSAPTGEFADTLKAACFGGLSPYEVLYDGRKLVGLAQVRRRAGALLQSGIHLRFDAWTLAHMLSCNDPIGLAAALDRAAVGLDTLCPAISVDQVMAAFSRALAVRLDIALVESPWTDAEIAHARGRQEDMRHEISAVTAH